LHEREFFARRTRENRYPGESRVESRDSPKERKPERARERHSIASGDYVIFNIHL
jgi:hypothetical protein